MNGSTVTLSWSARSAGTPAGCTLTASASPGGPPIATVPVSGTGASFANAPAGPYYVVLTESNAEGASPPSTQVTLTVP
jgi:hypothetical protein